MVIAKYFHLRRRLFETGHVKMGRVQVGEKNSRSIHARSGPFIHISWDRKWPIPEAHRHSFARVLLIARADDSRNFSGSWFHCYLSRFFVTLVVVVVSVSLSVAPRGVRFNIRDCCHLGFTERIHVDTFAQGEWIATVRCFLFFLAGFMVARNVFVNC